MQKTEQLNKQAACNTLWMLVVNPAADMRQTMLHIVLACTLASQHAKSHQALACSSYTLLHAPAKHAASHSLLIQLQNNSIAAAAPHLQPADEQLKGTGCLRQQQDAQQQQTRTQKHCSSCASPQPTDQKQQH
jgi:hypothetical protein